MSTETLCPCPFCGGAAWIIAFGGPDEIAKSYDLPKQRRQLLRAMSRCDLFFAHATCRSCFADGPNVNTLDSAGTKPAEVLNELLEKVASRWNKRVAANQDQLA